MRYLLIRYINIAYIYCLYMAYCTVPFAYCLQRGAQCLLPMFQSSLYESSGQESAAILNVFALSVYLMFGK